MATPMLSDTELLALFHQDPHRAWRLFIDKYADFIFARLQRLGFDYDQAMDRFVYICEKLCEDDFHKLKTIRYAGRSGDLVPWLHKVIKNLCINWTWSAEGRKRLLKPIAQLPVREQRVFELYFWKGLSPLEIYDELRLRQQLDIDLSEVFNTLEYIFAHLSQKKLWRLMSNLARTRRTISLDAVDEETGLGLEPADPRIDPEETLMQKEVEMRVNRALAGLLPRERLIVQLRYEECLSVRAIADILQMPEAEVKSMARTSIEKLRRVLK